MEQNKRNLDSTTSEQPDLKHRTRTENPITVSLAELRQHKTIQWSIPNSENQERMEASAQPTLDPIQNSEVRHLAKQTTVWSNSPQAEPMSQDPQINGWLELARRGEAKGVEENSLTNPEQNIHPDGAQTLQLRNQQIEWEMDPGGRKKVKGREQTFT